MIFHYKKLLKITSVMIMAFFILNYFPVSPAFSASASATTVILKLSAGKSIDHILTKYKASIDEYLPELDAYLVRLPDGSVREDILYNMGKDPSIEYSQPNYDYSICFSPNDPDYSKQWGFPKVKADLARDILPEKDYITVAVLDTGLYQAHPDLTGKTVSGYNTISSSDSTNDDNGHGTHVSGIISAGANNGTGIAGVATRSLIMPVKVADSSGIGCTINLSKGIVWAADHGAMVINISMAGPNYDRLLQSAVDYAYNKGVTVVAAAGNGNSSKPYYPAALNHVIAVSAIGKSVSKAPFSNYGNYVDLAAPGADIYSTTSDGKFGYMSGTSMASAYVAGAAAYLFSAGGMLSPDDVEKSLTGSAYDIGYSGKDVYYGYGLLDIYKAILPYSSGNSGNPPPQGGSDNNGSGSSGSSSGTQNSSGTGNNGTDSNSQSSDTNNTDPSPSTSPSSASTLPAIGNIESPSDMETISGTYEISGWFLDAQSVSRLDIQIDGQVKGQAVYGAARSDIAAKYPEYNNTNCGFHFSLDTSSLANGVHTLKINETSKTGVQNALSQISFNVTNYSAKLGNIIYYLSEDANVTIEIYDSLGNLVRVLEQNVPKQSGLNSSQWDGRDSRGNIVRDGVYTYKITAFDKAGLASPPATGTITVERCNPEITQVSDTPDPINPWEAITSTINFTLSENANTYINIYDSNGNLIKNLFSSPVTFGASKAVWDGTNNSGSFVSNGTYTYKINASDPFNKKAKTVSGTITLTGAADPLSPPVISRNTVEPNPYSPDGKNSVAISYLISDNCTVGILITDSAGKTVKPIETNASKSSGENSAVWDGKNASGQIVPAGTYKYVITAVNGRGLSAVPASGTITVKKDELIINVIGDSPDPFNPAAAKANTIEYSITKSAQVTVKILDGSGKLIRTVFDGQAYSGANNASWDGRNTSGSLVADGKYKYQISATDNTGLSAAPATGDITVTSTKLPLIQSVSDAPDPFTAGNGNKAAIYYTLNESASVNIQILDTTGHVVKNLVSDSMSSGVNQAAWDGTNDSAGLAASGIYYYIIDATGISSKNHAQVKGSITLNRSSDEHGGNTVLSITNCSAAPNPFEPSGNSRTMISYTLSKDAQVTVIILDENSTPVRRLESDASKSSGVNSINWDGRSDSGVLVLGGKYQYMILASDSQTGTSASGEIFVEYAPAKINSLSHTPEPFSISTGSSCSISFVLSKDADVILQIYDSSGNPVKTLADSSFKSGVNTVWWDGKDENGIIAKDGIYRLNAGIKDSTGKTAYSYNDFITVDSSSPTVKINSVSPNPFVLGTSNSVAVSYSLSKPAKVNISIYDTKNTLIKTVNSGISKAAGNNSASWDGTDTAGIQVIEGTYKVVITATGSSGSESAPASVSFTVKHKAPDIAWFNDSPDPFGIDGKNVCTISYSISKKASVKIIIYDVNGKAVKTLLNSVKVNSGTNSVVWDGKDASASLVAGGVYTYTIDAVDEFGNKADQKKGIINVDSTPPELTNGNAAPDPFTPTE